MLVSSPKAGQPPFVQDLPASWRYALLLMMTFSRRALESLAHKMSYYCSTSNNTSSVPLIFKKALHDLKGVALRRGEEGVRSPAISSSWHF